MSDFDEDEVLKADSETEDEEEESETGHEKDGIPEQEDQVTYIYNVTDIITTSTVLKRINIR